MIDPKKIALRALMEERGCRDCLYFDSKEKTCSLGFRYCILFQERRADDTGRFAIDKPAHCRNCYWWDARKAVCRRGGPENCAYLILQMKMPPEDSAPELKEERGLIRECAENGSTNPTDKKARTFSCRGCPYGHHQPCVSFCMRKVLTEWRAERAAAGKEVSVYA